MCFLPHKSLLRHRGQSLGALLATTRVKEKTRQLYNGISFPCLRTIGLFMKEV